MELPSNRASWLECWKFELVLQTFQTLLRFLYYEKLLNKEMKGRRGESESAGEQMLLILFQRDWEDNVLLGLNLQRNPAQPRFFYQTRMRNSINPVKGSWRTHNTKSPSNNKERGLALNLKAVKSWRSPSHSVLIYNSLLPITDWGEGCSCRTFSYIWGWYFLFETPYSACI